MLSFKLITGYKLRKKTNISYLLVCKVLSIFAKYFEKRLRRGRKSPLFMNMVNQQKVAELLQEALDENPALFLIELKFLKDNRIKVIVDGDSGIPLSECVRISRNIEHNLDREEVDFALEVTSPDIAHPLKVKRQYKKNLTRTLKVKTQNEEFEGVLNEVTDEKITLHWKVREPKPVGKGKHTVEKTAEISFNEIVEAKVKIIF